MGSAVGPKKPIVPAFPNVHQVSQPVSNVMTELNLCGNTRPDPLLAIEGVSYFTYFYGMALFDLHFNEIGLLTKLILCYHLVEFHCISNTNTGTILIS